ncbi:hypothetical protein M0802_009182 [Mischocyttarus mexicanus]|nr:hypothetical protein M0802_009182 [Mischocyttarus mexicanus]
MLCGRKVIPSRGTTTLSYHIYNIYIKNTLRILFCQLVRPILEYGSIIWSPYCITHSYDIEKVQHKFLRLAANHCGHPMPFYCHNYDSILDRMNLSTLSKRRMIADIIFVCKTANGLINCSDIVNIFSLNVPLKNLRSRELLHILPHSTSYSYYSSFNRMFSNVNRYCNHFDIFSQSISTVRNILNRTL